MILGLSAGAVAGIVVGTILGVGAASGGAVAAVKYKQHLDQKKKVCPILHPYFTFLFNLSPHILILVLPLPIITLEGTNR